MKMKTLFKSQRISQEEKLSKMPVQDIPLHNVQVQEQDISFKMGQIFKSRKTGFNDKHYTD